MLDIGEKRPRLGQMHVVAEAFRARGQQVFIEAGRFGQIASEFNSGQEATLIENSSRTSTRDPTS